MPQVRVHGGDEWKKVDLEGDEAAVADVLAKAAEVVGNRQIFVNGNEADLDTKVRDKDDIVLSKAQIKGGTQ